MSQFNEGHRDTGRKASSRWRQLSELLFFLFVALPGVAIALSLLMPSAHGFFEVVAATMLQDLLWLAIVLLLVRRAGLSVRQIGWVWKRPGREIVLGVLLFIPLFIAIGYVETLLQSVGFSAPTAPPSILIPKYASQFILAVAFVLVVAVAEETIFRGYLILRITGVTGSPAIAVLLSSAIFGVGHGYEGATGVIIVTLIGLAFALLFRWRKTLWGPVTMHVLQNFVSLVLVPILARH